MKNAKWDSLTNLCLSIYDFILGINRIGDKGCKYISSLYIPNLKNINLSKIYDKIDNNTISTIRVSHLIKSDWKNIQSIGIGI